MGEMVNFPKDPARSARSRVMVAEAVSALLSSVAAEQLHCVKQLEELLRRLDDIAGSLSAAVDTASDPRTRDLFLGQIGGIRTLIAGTREKLIDLRFLGARNANPAEAKPASAIACREGLNRLALLFQVRQRSRAVQARTGSPNRKLDSTQPPKKSGWW